MNPINPVAQLDKLDTIIRPGLFVVAILLIVLELIVLSLKKVSLNHKGVR